MISTLQVSKQKCSCTSSVQFMQWFSLLHMDVQTRHSHGSHTFQPFSNFVRFYFVLFTSLYQSNEELFTQLLKWFSFVPWFFNLFLSFLLSLSAVHFPDLFQFLECQLLISLCYISNDVSEQQYDISTCSFFTK